MFYCFTRLNIGNNQNRNKASLPQKNTVFFIVFLLHPNIYIFLNIYLLCFWLLKGFPSNLQKYFWIFHCIFAVNILDLCFLFMCFKNFTSELKILLLLNHFSSAWCPYASESCFFIISSHWSQLNTCMKSRKLSGFLCPWLSLPIQQLDLT